MAPAKRKAGAATQTASKKTQKTQKKGKGKAKRREVQVPVDEAFSDCIGAEVFISDDGTIHDASLNQTNIGDNNNKVSPIASKLYLANVVVLLPSIAQVQGLWQILHPYPLGQGWRVRSNENNGSFR